MKRMAIMAARLTDKQKKKIVADYLETQSVNLAAKRNGVSWDSAKKAIEGAGEIEKKLEQKKQENTADILAYMENKRNVVCEIIDTALKVLPEKIENARTASEVTTALGTIIDKWLQCLQLSNAVTDKNVFEDDPITQAIKKEAGKWHYPTSNEK